MGSTPLHLTEERRSSGVCSVTSPFVLFLKDGTVIVHTIRRGQFLRSLRPPGDGSVPAHISQLQVGMEGHMVVQTSLEERPHREVR